MDFHEAAATHPWNRDLCRDLAREFAQSPARQWEEVLARQGVPCVRVAEDNREGIFSHPQASALEAVSRKLHPEYTNLAQAGVMLEFSQTSAEDGPAAPVLGQHTREVLLDLGYAEEEISELEASGAVLLARGPSATPL